MTGIIYSFNETLAFRHFFHYYYFVGEACRLTPPEQSFYTPNFYEAELIAFDYKEYRNEISGLVGNNLKAMPSGN